MASDVETVRLPDRGPQGGQLRLLVLGERFATARVLPARGRVVIGRGEGADVLLDDRSISRSHAVLHLGDEVTLEDLGSANGTWVRERKLAERETVPLQPGDVVELGSTLLILQREGARPLDGRRLVADRHAGPVGASPMAQLERLADRVARSSIAVLIQGETGVGKEVLATRLHERSARAAGPFVKINCAALSATLSESELFGHDKGVYTGADRAREGLFAAADGGTVLLDEVGEMPLELQAKLLRVLENKEVRRLGDVKERPIDVRVLSSTNRDLEGEVERGTFRRDLYFRLNGFALEVPPLRERLDELPGLAQGFVAQACARERQPAVPTLAPEVLGALARHAWPGNLRELRNAMDRAVLLCTDGVITAEHLPTDLRRAARPVAGPSTPAGGFAVATPAAGSAAVVLNGAAASLRDEVQAAERRRIVEALAQCQGNQTRAAELLGISRRTLVSRIEQYGLPRPRGKR